MVWKTYSDEATRTHKLMVTANKTTTQNTKPTATAAKPVATSAPVNSTKVPAATVAATVAAQTATQALAPVDASLMALLDQTRGQGFEEAGADAFATPFLVILQDLSPQTKKLMPGYIEGARPGNILQSVSHELFTDNIRVVPCYYSQVFIEWVAREKKGGLVAIHPAETPLRTQITRDEMNRPMLPNGNLLEDTRQHFVLLVRHNGEVQPCLIAMKGTQIKPSKQWMASTRASYTYGTQLLSKLPMYACSYLLGVEEQANEKGSWYVWNASKRELITDIELFKQGRDLYETVRRGQTKANYEDLRSTESETVSRNPDVPEDIDNEIDA